METLMRGGLLSRRAYKWNRVGGEGGYEQQFMVTNYEVLVVT